MSAVIIMLAEFFLLSLALGVGFFFFLAKPKESGAGLIKLLSSVCLASNALAFILHLTYGRVTDPQSVCSIVAMIAFLLTYLFHKDQKSAFMWVLYVIHNLALMKQIHFLQNGYFDDFSYSLSSILYLGSITYAMLMGHWYLVTPKLSEKPLIIASYFCWLFLLIKITWTTYSFIHLEELFVTGTREAAGYLFNWIMLTMRVGWGYLVVGIMSYFSYRLIKMRSIQSATGMLYAMTFFVFIGELISMYLFFQYRIKL